MAFGKYKGLTYQQVMDDHPDYLVWGKLQKTPSIYLQKFLEWAIPGVGASTTRTPLRAPGSASLPGPGTQVPQVGQLCPDGCSAFSRRGSNAYFNSTTCLVCGTVVSTPIQGVPT